ncbi:MAG TPA: slipin family protein [Pyrinomonadaceae bacterium]|jgi:regulator of protease activity HflC (stomatin/prohibitin superfamily)
MKLLPRKFSVAPNHVGYLFRKNRFDVKLEPGIYRFFDPLEEIHVVTLPITIKIQNIANQEVLTQDNIALRFSYFIEYRIGDPDKYITRFDVHTPFAGTFEAEQLLHNLTQVYLRDLISKVLSEDLNERREELLNVVPETLRRDLSDYGLEIVRLMLRDVTFPKAIQDLFARHLEAKIRAKADLENARTAVATARALKNAAELMKDDDNIRFFQLLETITKIADKGKHTFVFGDMQRGGLGMQK